MFGNDLSNKEREKFMNIAMAGKKEVEEAERGRVLYTLKKGNASKQDLKDLFPEEYRKAVKLKKREKGFLGLFDKTNYVYKYFLTIHNEEYDCKVKPGKIIGFKAEKKGDKKHMKARVEYPDGEVAEGNLEIFPGVKLTDLNLNTYVLVHRGTICQELTEKEYNKILEDYYKK